MTYQNFFLTLLVLLSFQSTYPVIIGAETLVDSNGTHPNVTLLYSYHRDHPGSALTKYHQAQVVDFVTKNNAAVVAEDVIAYNGNNKIIKTNISAAINGERIYLYDTFLKFSGELDYSQTIQDDYLVGLLKALPKHIPSINVECRHYSRSSIGRPGIPAKLVYHFFSKLTEEMLSHRQDRAFSHYQFIISKFLNNNQNLLKSIKNENRSICQVFDINEYWDYFEMYDMDLVDLLMLRSIEQLKNSNHIVMCAGGLHCRNVSQYLKELGYRSAKANITQEFQFGPYLELSPIDINQYFNDLIISGYVDVRQNSISIG